MIRRNVCCHFTRSCEKIVSIIYASISLIYITDNIDFRDKKTMRKIDYVYIVYVYISIYERKKNRYFWKHFVSNIYFFRVRVLRFKSVGETLCLYLVPGNRLLAKTVSSHGQIRLANGCFAATSNICILSLTHLYTSMVTRLWSHVYGNTSMV